MTGSGSFGKSGLAQANGKQNSGLFSNATKTQQINTNQQNQQEKKPVSLSEMRKEQQASGKAQAMDVDSAPKAHESVLVPDMDSGSMRQPIKDQIANLLKDLASCKKVPHSLAAPSNPNLETLAQKLVQIYKRPG